MPFDPSGATDRRTVGARLCLPVVADRALRPIILLAGPTTSGGVSAGTRHTTHPVLSGTSLSSPGSAWPLHWANVHQAAQGRDAQAGQQAVPESKELPDTWCITGTIGSPTAGGPGSARRPTRLFSGFPRPPGWRSGTRNHSLAPVSDNSGEVTWVRPGRPVAAKQPARRSFLPSPDLIGLLSTAPALAGCPTSSHQPQYAHLPVPPSILRSDGPALTSRRPGGCGVPRRAVLSEPGRIPGWCRNASISHPGSGRGAMDPLFDGGPF